MKPIFIKEASRICGVTPPTFDSFTKKKPPWIRPKMVVPPDRRLFDRGEVEELAGRLSKGRGRGVHITIKPRRSP